MLVPPGSLGRTTAVASVHASIQAAACGRACPRSCFLEAARRPLHSQLRPIHPVAGVSRAGGSRDPDHVSLTLAAESAAAPASAADNNTHQAPQQQQAGSVQAPPTPAGGVDHDPQPQQPQHSKGFGVTVQQLRQLVQAGVDDSQSDAAAGVIQALVQQLQQKQQQRRHHKHAHQHKDKEGGGGGGAVSTAGSAGSLSSVASAPESPAARPPTSNGTTSQAAPSTAGVSGDSLALLPRALASALGSSLSSGLSGSPADVDARLAAFGSNSLAAAATSSFLQLLLEAASDSTLLLLMAAGAVSLGLAAGTGKEAVDFIDGAAILASVAICVTVTAVTNYQKESKFRQLNSLKENIPVRVVRGGQELTLSCFDLLVGDLLLVEAGDILPADGLLVAGGQIKVDESHLTGESDDVVKEPPAAAAAAAAAAVNSSNGSSSSSSGRLSSCLCMSGSKVLEGFGRMLVLAVGPNSQQGMIQQMVMTGVMQQTSTANTSSSGSSSGSSMLREATPLMSRLEEVAGSIGGVGLAAAVGVLAVNSGLYTAELLGAGLSPWTGASLEAYLSFFITSMTLLVVAVPEGLPLAVTLALAFSVQRMLADNNLVRNLSSCETMAAATAICSDKTGTLTENNMAVVKLVVGGATFSVRPSARASAAAAAAGGGTTTTGGGSGSSRSGSPHAALPSGTQSTRAPAAVVGSSPTTLRSTSSIGASTTAATTTSSDEGGRGQVPALGSGSSSASRSSSPGTAVAASLNSQNGSSSGGGSGSGSSNYTSVSSAVASTASADAATWPPVSAATRRKQQQQRNGKDGVAAGGSSSNGFRPDVLTMVSLSLDGEPALESPTAAAAAGGGGVQQEWGAGSSGAEANADSYGNSSGSNSDSELLTATGSLLGPAADGSGVDSVAGGGVGAVGGAPASSPSSSSPKLSRALKQLLADSISLNSTASIRLVDVTAAAAAAAGGSPTGSDNDDSQQLQEQQLDAQALAAASCSTGGSRQLDRSGNRTECALLEFGGRLEGRLLPGCGSAEQAQRVLQVFPFSSTRKRMSSLVATGPPLSTPGTAGGVGQPARLYVKGAAELLLDSCRLQVSLDGSLVPLPPDQVQQLKARCGRGGLRVLALAYKDMLLQPSAAGDSSRRSSSSSGGGASDWQLLDGDDEQQDLVLIGLLALEDPVRAEVPGAIRDCQRAGIAVRMITGDNAATAAAIAASCGILPPQLAQQIEDTRLQQAAAGSSNGGGSSSMQQQQQQVAELQQLLASWAATSGSRPGSRSSSTSSSTPDTNSSWLDGVLHGLSGAVSSKPDPDAGAALLSSVSPDPRLAVLEGPVFRALVLRPEDGSTDLEAFAALWPHLRVMARCTPADKYTLVQAVKALRARGELMETIAVTGDGTNDAPALNAADVGFAMAAGTSIAKDASDILLLDNNFRSIVSAVKWGRNVYSSVTKFLQFQLTANVVALVTAAGGALALRSSPLSAVQMLWVNLIMDSLASLALATEAPTDSMLDEAPRERDGPIITPTVAKSIVGQAALQLGVMAALLGPLGDALTTHASDTAAVTTTAMVADGAGAALAAVTAATVAAVGEGGAERIEQYTLVFNSFVLMQLFNQVNSRKIHDERSVLEGLGQQRLFLIILGLELGLQVAIVEAGGRAFSTVPLSSTQWAVCVGFGGLTLLLRQALRAIPTEPPPPPSSPPPPHNTTSGQDGGGSGRGWQAAASAAAQSAASALQAAVAAPVRGAKRILQGAGATAVQSHGGRDMGAAKQQGRHLRQQPARR